LWEKFGFFKKRYYNLWGHGRILPAHKLVKLFSKEGIIMQSVDYFKLLPNKAGLSIRKKNSRHFLDNNFTLWLSKFLENKMPVSFKKISCFFLQLRMEKKFFQLSQIFA